MAQRNTYREDEELEEQINFRDILRVGKYLKPYMAQVARILVVVISMSCIVVAVPYPVSYTHLTLPTHREV